MACNYPQKIIYIYTVQCRHPPEEKRSSTGLPSHNTTFADTQALTAALLVAVVDAVIGAVTSGPLRNAAVVCFAGELSVLIALVVWTHWSKRREKGRSQVRNR